MHYQVYLDELEEKSDELIRFSRNDMKNKVQEIKKDFNDLNWHGEAHDSYAKGYDARIEKINTMMDRLSLLGEYLKMCKDSYWETNEKLENSWNEFMDELDKEKRLKDEL